MVCHTRSVHKRGPGCQKHRRQGGQSRGQANKARTEEGLWVVCRLDDRSWPDRLGMKSVPLDQPLYGLSVRSANCLQNAGLTDKDKIRSAAVLPFVNMSAAKHNE